jgi:hypothetical protein
MGRFKNKKVVVKTITYDDWGMPLVNGKPICTFRVLPKKKDVGCGCDNCTCGYKES